MHKDYKLLIPGTKKYKIIDLITGKVNYEKQPKNPEEKIFNIYIINEKERHLLYRIENRQLTFFITSKCNHNCIMCPQELNIDSLDNDFIVQKVIENLDFSIIDEVCFTGGEPLIKLNLIDLFLRKSPKNVLVTILTNGSIYPSKTILESNRCKLCVPLYSYFDKLHNEMTGSDSFYRVVYNLMEISQYNIPIELRFVLTKKNISNLEEFGHFVWRNLPFVQDVAFMGIELTAEALINKEALWINPIHYIDNLQKTVQYLDSVNITSWIYNLPYCLFDEQYRKFLVPSISPWKVQYLPICNDCKLKKHCGGMFFSDIKDFESIVTKNIN